jgi:hypothetical protein
MQRRADLEPYAIYTPLVLHAASAPASEGGTPPTWRVLCTAIGPAILAGVLRTANSPPPYWRGITSPTQ